MGILTIVFVSLMLSNWDHIKMILDLIKFIKIQYRIILEGDGSAD